LLYTKSFTLDVHNVISYDVRLCKELTLYSVLVVGVAVRHYILETLQHPSWQTSEQKFLQS